jgi:hypothetical protein
MRVVILSSYLFRSCDLRGTSDVTRIYAKSDRIMSKRRIR